VILRYGNIVTDVAANGIPATQLKCDCWPVFVAITYYFLIASHPSQSRFVNRAELEHIAEGSSAALSRRCRRLGSRRDSAGV